MIIGITGGIGSGKTTIGRVVTAMGYTLYNSDNWANRLMSCDSEVVAAITKNFGADSYTSEGLNREYLASQVFGNSDKLLLLESIVHPAVFRHFESFSESFSNELLFVESAILFESHFDRYCDKVITVSADEQLRISRVIKRDGSSYDAVLKRIRSQMSDQQREELSDYTIVCDETQSVVCSIAQIIAQIKP